MISVQHMIFATIISLTLAVAFFDFDILPSFLLFSGSIIGVIIPDIHMKKPKNKKIILPVYWITLTSKISLGWAIRKIFKKCLNILPDENDKRITHSIPGLLIISALILTAFGIITLILHFTATNSMLNLLIIFFTGIITGYILHLTEDACTFKGIYPLFPFRDMKISGNIQPCNKTDNRIPYYQTGFLFILALTTALKISYYDTDYPALMAIFGIAIITGAMFIFSKIQKNI